MSNIPSFGQGGSPERGGRPFQTNNMSRQPDRALPDRPLRQRQISGAVAPEPRVDQSAVDLPPVAKNSEPSTIRENLWQDDPFERPVVTNVNGNFLVGVRHRTPILAPIPQDYMDAVKAADHLILEGRESSYTAPQTKPSDFDYERTAFQIFTHTKEGSVHFLNDDRGRYLTDAGVDPEVVRFRYALPELDRQRHNEKGWHTDPTYFDKTAIVLKKVLSAFDELSVIQISQRLEDWTQHLSTTDSWGIVGEATKPLIDYSASLADVHAFGPTVAELLKLPGTKTIFVGKYHIPAMTEVARGKSVTPPPAWEDFVANFTREQKTAWEHLTRAARP